MKAKSIQHSIKRWWVGAEKGKTNRCLGVLYAMYLHRAKKYQYSVVHNKKNKHKTPYGYMKKRFL